jgi:hypothetical protein
MVERQRVCDKLVSAIIGLFTLPILPDGDTATMLPAPIPLQSSKNLAFFSVSIEFAVAVVMMKSAGL